MTRAELLDALAGYTLGMVAAADPDMQPPGLAPNQRRYLSHRATLYTIALRALETAARCDREGIPAPMRPGQWEVRRGREVPGIKR